MSLNFTIVDAFTNKPFCGNPAAVIVLPEGHSLPDSTLQGIAIEFNISETAFVTRPADCSLKKGPDCNDYVEFGLRWFTPGREVRLCGHATLATSSVLFADESLVPPHVNEIHFSTLSGILKARRAGQQPPKFELAFPSGMVEPATADIEKYAREIVAEAIKDKVEVLFVGVSRREPYDNYLLIEIDGSAPLKGMEVDAGRLGPAGTQFTIVTICQRTSSGDAGSGSGYDYRVFAAPEGIQEDPVCGSAISLSASYWESKTRSEVREDEGAEFVNHVRAVSSRGGEIDAVCVGGLVKLRGEARVASRGEIFL
ncbi:hypothetical protein FRC17_005620 [Serendipita sp. 399]|nr:hypothetical protein FRC17_005620 [Serendipita sp. 399]